MWLPRNFKHLRVLLRSLPLTPLQRCASNQVKEVKKMGTLKLVLLGVTGGFAVGTGYTIYKQNQANSHIINEKVPMPMLKTKPNVEISRTVKYNFDTSGLNVTLFQYQTCPFCCKVRAFLDYYGISYDLVEVDPVLRQSIRWSEYRKVPILLVKVDDGYQQLNDSSMILSALSSYLMDKTQTLDNVVGYFPNISFFDENGNRKSEIMNRYFLMFRDSLPKNRTVEEISEERKWRKWADEVLVHTLSPNVYRTYDEALQAFNWFSETGKWSEYFPSWERTLIIQVGSVAMWLIGKRLKKRHNLHEDVRESLYQQCNFWMREINKKGTPFMGGANPNLADITVYGVLSSIEGCDAFRDCLRQSKISKWYFAMKERVGGQAGQKFLT